MGLTMTRGKAPQQRSAAGIGPDMNAFTRFVCQADARPRQCHRRRQRGRPGGPAIRSASIFPAATRASIPANTPRPTRSPAAKPTRRHDHRLRPDGQLLRSGPRASGYDSLYRPRPQRYADHRAAAVAFTPPPTASTPRAPSTAWTTCRFRYVRRLNPTCRPMKLS